MGFFKNVFGRIFGLSNGNKSVKESAFGGKTIAGSDAGRSPGEFKAIGCANVGKQTMPIASRAAAEIDTAKEAKIAELSESLASLLVAVNIDDIAHGATGDVVNYFHKEFSKLSTDEAEQVIKGSFIFGEKADDETELQSLKRKMSTLSGLISLSTQVPDNPTEDQRREIAKLASLLSSAFSHAVEESLQEAVVDQYVNFVMVDSSGHLLMPKLDFANFKQVNSIAGQQKVKATTSAKSTVAKVLSDREKTFVSKTGVNVVGCGRRIIDMSGANNMCGYRSILSQIDSSCIGDVLSVGKPGATSLDTLEKVAWLRLIIAIGRVNQNMVFREVHSPEIKSALLDQTNKLGLREPDYGMLLTENVRYIAEAIGRKIAVVSDKYIRMGAKGCSLEINDQSSGYMYYNSLCADDARPADGANNPSAAVTYTAEQKQAALSAVLQDPDSIVLYHMNGNHFMSVQRADVI